LNKLLPAFLALAITVLPYAVHTAYAATPKVEVALTRYPVIWNGLPLENGDGTLYWFDFFNLTASAKMQTYVGWESDNISYSYSLRSYKIEWNWDKTKFLENESSFREWTYGGYRNVFDSRTFMVLPYTANGTYTISFKITAYYTYREYNITSGETLEEYTVRYEVTKYAKLNVYMFNLRNPGVKAKYVMYLTFKEKPAWDYMKNITLLIKYDGIQTSSGVNSNLKLILNNVTSSSTAYVWKKKYDPILASTVEDYVPANVSISYNVWNMSGWGTVLPKAGIYRIMLNLTRESCERLFAGGFSNITSYFNFSYTLPPAYAVNALKKSGIKFEPQTVTLLKPNYTHNIWYPIAWIHPASNATKENTPFPIAYCGKIEVTAYSGENVDYGTQITLNIEDAPYREYDRLQYVGEGAYIVQHVREYRYLKDIVLDYVNKTVDGDKQMIDEASKDIPEEYGRPLNVQAYGFLSTPVYSFAHSIREVNITSFIQKPCPYNFTIQVTGHGKTVTKTFNETLWETVYRSSTSPIYVNIDSFHFKVSTGNANGTVEFKLDFGKECGGIAYVIVKDASGNNISIIYPQQKPNYTPLLAGQGYIGSISFTLPESYIASLPGNIITFEAWNVWGTSSTEQVTVPVQTVPQQHYQPPQEDMLYYLITGLILATGTYLLLKRYREGKIP